MGAVSKISDLPENAENDYWELVRLGVEVLGGSTDVVNEARTRLFELPEEAQLLSYHESPLRRAELISGSSKPTEEQCDEFFSKGRSAGLLPKVS